MRETENRNEIVKMRARCGAAAAAANHLTPLLRLRENRFGLFFFSFFLRSFLLTPLTHLSSKQQQQDAYAKPIVFGVVHVSINTRSGSGGGARLLTRNERKDDFLFNIFVRENCLWHVII